MGRKHAKKRRLNIKPSKKSPASAAAQTDILARRRWDANHMATASCRLRVSDYYALRDILASYGMTVHSYFRIVAGIALLAHGSPASDGLRKDTMRAARRRVKALDALQNRSKLMSQISDSDKKDKKAERDTGPATDTGAIKVLFRYD